VKILPLVFMKSRGVDSIPSPVVNVAVIAATDVPDAPDALPVVVFRSFEKWVNAMSKKARGTRPWLYKISVITAEIYASFVIDSRPGFVSAQTLAQGFRQFALHDDADAFRAPARADRRAKKVP